MPGINKWLHRHGFRYKMPSGTPHKFSEVKQQQFIEYYENLKMSAGDEPILFLDTTHPTQATKITCGWIHKGYKKPVKTTGNRTHIPSSSSQPRVSDVGLLYAPAVTDSLPALRVPELGSWQSDYIKS